MIKYWFGIHKCEIIDEEKWKCINEVEIKLLGTGEITHANKKDLLGNRTHIEIRTGENEVLEIPVNSNMQEVIL